MLKRNSDWESKGVAQHCGQTQAMVVLLAFPEHSRQEIWVGGDDLRYLRG